MAPIQFTRGGFILLLLCVVFILKNEKTSAENAAFNVCKMIIKDSTCNFTINAHSVSGVTGYKIEFGDGNSVSFTDRTKVTSNAYNKVGVYTATLTFEGSTGPVKVAKTVTVREALVNATIQMTSFLCIVGKSISFSAIASPNISTDAYYKLGNSKWLSGNTMMCNETGYHGLLIFIENGVSAILFKCLVNITAVKSDLTWVPPVGAVNQSVTFTPSVTPAIDVSFLYIFLDNVVVNCSNSSVGFAFDDANLNPGHPVQVVITDSKKNSAQFTKNVPIAYPLVGPLKITCPGFVGIDLLASFSVSLTESNVSFIYNFGDNTTAVSIPQNTTTHSFSRQGRFTVKITAKGLVNEISSTCDVTVVESIQGLSCAQDVIATPLGNSTALGWVIENGTDFSIKFQINPSLPTYQVVNLSASDLLVIYKQHNYTAVGEYLVNLYAWNIVSNVSTFCRVLVQEAITYVNATIISPLDCIEMNQDVTVVVQSDGTTPLYEYDFDGNNTAYNTTSNSVSHKWMMYGNYTLKITARNNVSSKVFLKPVFVPKPVVLLNQIEIDTKVTNLTTKSKLVMRLGQGSDFKCNISWGPTLNTSLYCYNHTYFADKKSLNTTPFQNLVLSEEYVYPETGCFVVNVYCYNRRSNVTGTTTACVQKPITNFLPVPTIPQINGENFMVNFSMTAGTNVTVRGTMNDVDISPYAFVTDTNGSLIVQYSVHYKHVGHFSLDFFAKNLVSEVNSTSVIVTVQEAITELKCNVTSHYAFSQAGIQPGCTNKTDTFAAEYNITMNATPNKGTNLTCYYTLGDGRTVNTSSLSVEHKYSPEYKNYTTTVTCSNLVSSVTCAFPISMQKTVKSLTVTNNGPKKFKKPITFTLNVADFGTGTCFTLDYVDGTAIDVLGPDHCKLLTFPQGQTYISLAESSSFIATHPFDQVDEYYVKVNATNDVSCMATEIQAVAVLKECHYPNVSIIGAAENVTQANFYYKSEVVQLVAHTEVFCEVSNKTNYTWTIVKVKDFNNDTIDPPQEVIISGTSFTLSKLTILQRSLTYGVYKVSVTVYMSETVGVKTVKEAYFGISCTPYLEVKIKEGKVLKRTIGSSLTFNGSPSYDPDHGTDIYRNMTFYWFCRKKKEAQPNIHSPENVPLITIPNKNTKASTLTNGGCFGTGVGRLPLNSMTFSLDTSLPGIESGADNSLVVTLVVVKNDSCGVRVQNFDQYVELTKEGVPDLSTQCTLNCKREVNVNEKTSFKATCTGCNSQTIYKWSCKELKSCAEDPTDPKNTLRALTDEDFENLLYGKVSDFHIVFKEGKLEGGKCYFVTLTAANPARRRKRAVDSSKVGENAFLMETNKPPEKGSLVISPMVGYAMNTSFTFGFSNWQDTNIPLTYSCGIWDGINFQLIETTGEEEIQMILPAGDQAKNYNVTVRCKVTDRQGAATILDKQLQVRPANDEYSLLSFLVLDKDGALNQAVEKGDFAAILKISISVGEMLYKLNEANEDSLKGNITDAEKQKIEGRVEEIQKAQAEVITKLTLVKVDTMQDAEVLASALNGITKSYSSLDDQSQEKALMVMSTLKDLVVSANPLDQSFSSLKDTCAQLTSCFGQIASASAKTATYNSTETMFDITGSSKNPNITGMVSNRESAKVRVQAILKMTIDVNKLLLSNQLPGEAQLHLYSDTLNTTLAKVFVKDLGQASIGDGRTSVSLPPGEGMGMKLLDSTKDNIGCAVSSFLNPIITWTNTSNLIKSQLVDINMFGDGGKLLTLEGFTTPARIDVPRDAGKIPALENRFMRKYKANAEFDQYLQFHEVKLTSRDMANHLQIIPRNQTISLGVYIQFGERAYPEEGKFLYNWTVPDFSSCKLDDINETRMVGDHQVYMVDPDKYCDIDPYTVFITYDLLQKLGTIYITIVYTSFKDPPPTEAPRKRRAIPGVPCGSHGGRMKRSCVFIPPPPPTPPTEPPWGVLVEVGTKNPLEDLMGNLIDLNNTIKYDVRIFQTNCLFFNETAQAYLNYGCKVSNKTRKDKVVCLCNHFTSFGSDFFVAPNPIDFDKVFSADLSKNPVVLSVVCGLFGLYLILVVFARRADKRDEKKTGVTPLPANAAPGSHSFLISIHTGVRMNAGTTANVYVVLSGEEGEAPPVLLTDPERPLFTRGADNALVMTIPKDVGKITHLRVWHDNTGLSPSWYLSRIALEDLHNHNKVYFVCERWLAVEEDDGRVDRIIPVASDKELTQFNHLFVSKTVRELGDGHLWFSIIARPPQSVFTRVQRLSVALSLLYCTMITSCMFYNTGGQKEDPTYILYLGSLKIDLKQMIIGLQSSLIVFPVNLAFMQIFRNIRPDEPNTEKAEDITEGFDDVCEDDDMKDLEKKKKKKKEKKGLHPKWRYVAWAICALSTIASASFTVFYSLSWGPETANKWMIAFVLSFFQSVLLIQPVKVIFAAIVFALIIKKPIENEEESNKDEVAQSCTKNIPEKPMMSDDYMFSDGTRVGPPDELMLMAARQKRLKEIRMQIILREIIAFFMFMAVLLLVAYGNRDPNAYLLRKSLYDSFVNPGVGDKVPFNGVGDVDSFWFWTRETLLPTLYPGPWYNGQKDKYKGFLDDRHNYLVGISRLRQERIKPDTCTVVPIMRHIFPTCYGQFSMSNIENRDFDTNWKYLNKSKTAAKRKRRSVQEQLWFVGKNDKLVEYDATRKILKRKRRAIDPVYKSDSGRQARKRDRGASKTYTILETAILPDGSIMSCPTRWQYHTMFELRGFPYWGMLNFYGGGGYPADLGYDYSTAMTVIADTNSHNWLDVQSRAVFNEFTIYNANTNLFAAAFLFMEFLPDGGAFSTANFVVSRLYSYVGPFAKLILAMEVIMLVFMFYFMYREFKLMYKQGKAYFHGFWNWIEVILIVLEFVMTILFFARMWETDKNFIKLHHNPKDFVSFQYATAADQTLTYVIGFLVFLVTLRFLKLLRFNKKMAFIGTTISVIAKPIGLFMISFSVVFASYNCFGVLIFGAASDYYKDNVSAAVTQMRILLGDFDYFELTDIEPILGPLYFFTYMYLIVFFLMNMFLAIINDSFSEVKELEDKLSNEYEMVEFIMERLKNQMAFMKRGNPSQVKTPYGPGSAVPFWEYKRRKSSISSDSEFSCTTNLTAIKAKRDLKLMEDDLSDLIKRLSEMEVEDVESDEAFIKVAQNVHSRGDRYSDSESDAESDAGTQFSNATKSGEDDAISRSTDLNTE